VLPSAGPPAGGRADAEGGRATGTAGVPGRDRPRFVCAIRVPDGSAVTRQGARRDLIRRGRPAGDAEIGGAGGRRWLVWSLSAECPKRYAPVANSSR
jgi:hypothetical protein